MSKTSLPLHSSLTTFAQVRDTLASWRTAFDAALGFEALDRPQLVDVEREAAGAFTLEHKLQRAVRRWVIVSPRHPAKLWQTGDGDDTGLPLECDGPLSCQLWVW